MENQEKTWKHVSFREHKGKYKGILAWILSTDHKRIGLLYLFTIMGFFYYRGIFRSGHEAGIIGTRKNRDGSRHL